MSSNKNSDEKTRGFTVDADHTGVDIPSITKLLNRKSLKIANGLITPPAPPSPPSAPSKKPEIQSQAAPLQIRPGRRERRSETRITLWEQAALAASSDPIQSALGDLLSAGSSCGVFLALHLPAAGAGLPRFGTVAGYGPREKLRLWTGMKWDPGVAPAIWNEFTKDGVVEIPLPAGDARFENSRGIIRTAFGCEPDECLTLIRVGPVAACAGALAVYSSASILDAAGAALRKLATAARAAA